MNCNKKTFKPKPWILPQPVLIIGTYNADGSSNAMNAAWAGQWDAEEIMISLGSHATTDNLARCPEFTVAFATIETMKEADYVGIVSGRTHPHKLDKTGWTSGKGQTVNALPNDFRMPHKVEIRRIGNRVLSYCRGAQYNLR